jgi:hypothetical protein
LESRLKTSKSAIETSLKDVLFDAQAVMVAHQLTRRREKIKDKVRIQLYLREVLQGSKTGNRHKSCEKKLFAIVTTDSIRVEN